MLGVDRQLAQHVARRMVLSTTPWFVNASRKPRPGEER